MTVVFDIVSGLLSSVVRPLQRIAGPFVKSSMHFPAPIDLHRWAAARCVSKETAAHLASGPNFMPRGAEFAATPGPGDSIALRPPEQTQIGQLCLSGIEIVAWPV
jgi:hypothetical protein